VTAIGFGYVLLRRAEDAPTLARYERLTQPIPSEGGLGAHLAQALAAHDRLTDLSDAELLSTHLKVQPDVTESRHHLPGAADPSVIELRQGAGFGRSIQADAGLAAFVGACDGELSAGRLLAAIAQLMEVDERTVVSGLLPAIRELVVDGFLDFA
jgi:hypothetical protein